VRDVSVVAQCCCSIGPNVLLTAASSCTDVGMQPSEHAYPCLALLLIDPNVFLQWRWVFQVTKPKIHEICLNSYRCKHVSLDSRVSPAWLESSNGGFSDRARLLLQRLRAWDAADLGQEIPCSQGIRPLGARWEQTVEVDVQALRDTRPGPKVRKPIRHHVDAVHISRSNLIMKLYWHCVRTSHRMQLDDELSPCMETPQSTAHVSPEV